MKDLWKYPVMRFIIVGFLSVTVDWSIYLMCTRWLGFPYWIDKTFSFFCGTLFSFIANGKWTFQSELTRRKLGKHMLVYTLSLVANVVTNQTLLNLLVQSPKHQRFFALLAATSVSTALNYIGLKKWIFSTGEGSSVGPS